MLRVSRSLKDLAYKTLQMKEYLTNKLGRIPTYSEIAHELDVKEIDVLVALESTYDPISMYTPIYNDGGDTIYLYDQISNSEEEYDLDYKLALDKAISKLKDRDRKILEERFVIGKTQMEIASELGISQAQISRIEKNAINSLKKYVK
jgi:RNA polymerase sporulation-specific sigma factor